MSITLEHVAIWTDQLEKLKEYYSKYFGGKANDKYTNHTKGFESYFLSFSSGACPGVSYGARPGVSSGARLEIMSMPGIPGNLNDTITSQHKGIIHLAFGVASAEEVDAKAKQLQTDGFPILSGPRKTGDGYYEFETLDPDNNRLEVTYKFP